MEGNQNQLSAVICGLSTGEASGTVTFDPQALQSVMQSVMQCTHPSMIPTRGEVIQSPELTPPQLAEAPAHPSGFSTCGGVFGAEGGR